MIALSETAPIRAKKKNSGSGKAAGLWQILWCIAHNNKKHYVCMYVFLDTLTCSFKMVQIILPNVVYLQWMFKYIQQ